MRTRHCVYCGGEINPAEAGTCIDIDDHLFYAHDECAAQYPPGAPEEPFDLPTRASDGMIFDPELTC